MKLHFNTLLVFCLLFWGALGKVFRGCSKADDLAHAGSLVKTVEHTPYQLSTKSLGRYISAEASVLRNPAALRRHLDITETVDRRVLEDLAINNSEVKAELKSIDEKFLPSEKMKEYNDMIEKYGKNINFERYKSLFETLDFASTVKDFYELDGNMNNTPFKELTQNVINNQNGFTVHIPDHFYKVTSLTHPLINDLWINDKAAIMIYSFKDNYQKSLEEWKQAKAEDHKSLNIFAEQENLITFSVSDRKDKLFGCVKVLKKGKKVLFIEMAFKNQVEFLNQYKTLMAKI